jgi:hypothetical protein
LVLIYLPFAAFTGAYAAGLVTEEQRFDMVRHACPGAGAHLGCLLMHAQARTLPGW